MNRLKPHKSSTPVLLARAVLGVTLLLAILAGSFPLSTLASGPMCELACCAGRAPHAAGSCMNGSCHAFASSHGKKQHTDEAPPEHLCGLSKLTFKASQIPLLDTVTVDFTTGENQTSPPTSKSGPTQASIATPAMTKPCQQDCGSLISGSTRSKRQRQEAALAYLNRPRPPAAVGPRPTDYKLARTLSARLRRDAPRGPPLLFS